MDGITLKFSGAENYARSLAACSISPRRAWLFLESGAESEKAAAHTLVGAASCFSTMAECTITGGGVHGQLITVSERVTEPPSRGRT